MLAAKIEHLLSLRNAADHRTGETAAPSAETNHANFLALGDAPMMHGRVSRDAGAEQRRGCGEIEVGRHAQNEAFVNNDAFGVAAVGHASEVVVRRVEGENHVRAELLKAS